MKHFLRITAILLLLLVHIPSYATPDPCELQQVAKEIRQSVLERIRILSIGEVEREVWDIADGISMGELRKLFPKGCRSFCITGSFKNIEGMYVVRARFKYAECSFICNFLADFNIQSLKKIALLSDDADGEHVLWELIFCVSEKEKLNFELNL